MEIEEILKDFTFHVPDGEEMLDLNYDEFLEYLVITNSVFYYYNKTGYVMPQIDIREN